jgi:hypothetical protein
MIRTSLYVALVVAVSAGMARAQDSVVALIGDREVGAQLAKIVESTRAQGLPVEPILAKVHRGAMIHTPPRRILAAAAAVAARLPVARDALAPRSNTGDVIAAEDALSEGVNKEAIRAIREASPEPSIAVPLGVLTELVASGTKLSRASSIVLTLIKRGASGQQLAAMEKTISEDVSSGLTAEQALELRMNGLSAVLAPGSPAVSLTAPAGNPGGASTPPVKHP